jgi:serine/threonine protein phosphatase PrpC
MSHKARINLLMEFRSFGFLDKGKTRINNEDSYLCNEEERLFLVADGLGGEQEGLNMDVFLAGILKDDLYLLCSDGLYNMLDDGEILAIINSMEDGLLYKISLSLILEANLAGGLDNITVVLLSF